jgi:cysteinyl-tRNA synthetase
MKIYNTMHRRVEPFVPIKKGHVDMYVCGPTVNGPGHLGHASTYIAFDVIRRAFEYLGYEVKLVVNLTDIHDDMIKESNKRKITLFELADIYIERFMKDLDALHIKPAHVYPRVTEHITEIIEMIEMLEEKGIAYDAADGVYFDVAKFPQYGKLSGVKVEKGKSGQRVETDKYDKEGAADFVLWKKRKEGEPYWDSPWGKGRPGWHIECSVMSRKHLGQPFDIHGGALDLRFPHHENEIAQSEATYDTEFVKYWMHAGLLKVDGEKMSKSLGNFIEVPDVLKKYDPMVVRYWRATVHYRSEINYSDDLVDAAGIALGRLRSAVKPLKRSAGEKGTVSSGHKKRFEQALEDDFNTPEAVAVLWEAVKTKDLSDTDKLATIMDFDRVFGLGLDEVKSDEAELGQKLKAKIEQLIKERETARADGKWERADEIRDELADRGVELEDTPEGTVWKIV